MGIDKSKIEFEESTHIYKVNGSVIPSVTQILKEAGLIDLSFVDKDVLAYTSDLGRKVHETTELYDKGILDLESLHPLLKGYLDAWIKFRKESGFEPLIIEVMYHHPIFHYAGRIDRIGMMGKDLIQLDLKSGTAQAAYALQSAAYTELYNANNSKPNIKKRFAIYLSPNGKYNLKPYTDKNDLRVFYAALTLTNYKRSLR